MTEDKKRRAENLFAAMNGIDNRFLAEAIAAQSRRGKRRRAWRIPAVAASVVLVIALSVLAGRSIAGILNPERPSESDGKNDAPDGNTDFSAVLLACTESDAFTKETDAAGRIAPDGEVRIVIGQRGSDTLWISRPLTARECAVAFAETASAQKQRDFRPAGEDGYMVWLVTKGGEVWSPELTFSGGNITYGVLYSYGSERLPSTAFQNLLAGLAG